MLLRAALRAFLVDQIKLAGTDAGDKVFENRALATTAAALPTITVSTPQEHKEPQGRGSTLYTTLITVHISARAQGISDELAATAADALVAQILAATVGNQAVLNFDGLQQFAGIDSQIKISAGGSIYIADIDFVLMIELIERIDPTHPIPFTDIRSTVTTADGASLIFDAPLV